MAEVRKTKKWYRTKIFASYKDACEVLPEVIKKYGHHSKGSRNYSVTCDVSNHWNGSIGGFCLSKGKLYVEIYWAGAHTDGSDECLFHSSGVCLNAELEEDPFYGGTRLLHGNIQFNTKELYEAIQQVCINYLIPQEK